MSDPVMPVACRGFRWLQSWPFWLGILVLMLAVSQLYAWNQLRKARGELAADRLELAQRLLQPCRYIWPWNDSFEVHRVACQLAWKQGHLVDAANELRSVRRNETSTSNDLVYEWALVQAADGNVGEVDEYLQYRADGDPSLQRDVWQALMIGYLAIYRPNDAYAIARQWLNKYPEDTLALEFRGRASIQGRGRGIQLGIEDLQEVLKRHPEQRDARKTLALALLESSRYGEALPEFERLHLEQPQDPDHSVRLARCLKMTERSAEAIPLLEEVLKVHPDHGLALRTLGQFALGDNQLADAEKALRRAVQILPNDYQTRYLFHQVLQQRGLTAEAAEQMATAEAIRDRATQLAELRTHRLAERPLDPALHTEMGILLMKSNRKEDAVRWFQEAIALDPGYQPAHAALASYYESVGHLDQAQYHKRRLTGSTGK